MTRKSCIGCVYHQLLNRDYANFRCCHYCIVTGESRGCPPENCDKKLVVSKEEERKLLKKWQQSEFLKDIRGVKNDR